MLKCLLASVVALAATLASAQTSVPLPFVGSDGMVLPPLHYAQVVRALGEPPQSKVTPETQDWAKPSRYDSTPCDQPVTTNGHWNGNRCKRTKGGHHEFAYPELGLRFVIQRVHRPQADPPIWTMSITAPEAGQTPHGLHVGMPAPEALAIARRQYRWLREDSLPDRLPDSLTLPLASLSSNKTHTLTLTMKGGVLSRMEFDLMAPRQRQAWERWALAVVFLVAVGALAAFVAWMRERVTVRWPTPSLALLRRLDQLFLAGGAALVVGACIALGFAVMAMTSGDGLALVVGLVLALFALAGFAAGAWVVVRALRALRER